jgi:mRNA interferase MazF
VVAPQRGAVVLVRFPFSDLSESKIRPAVVLADAARGDWILCQVTSRPYGDARAIPLDIASFSSGSLPIVSYARPGKLFTASQGLMVSEAATLGPAAILQITEAVIGLLRMGRS